MPLIEPCILTGREHHELDLWHKEECYRFYVQQRRQNCSFMEVMNLWLLAPYCGECALSVPFTGNHPPHINPSNWEEDIALEVGHTVLERIKKELRVTTDFALLCKRCGRELKPWIDDKVYVVSYHLEEHYAIPLETPGRRRPSKRLRDQIFKLYDNRCFGCGSSRRLHIDHIVPQSKRG